MVEIKSGRVESEAQIGILVEELRPTSVVVPGDDEMAVTHWWAFESDEGVVLYFGTPETLERWKVERKGD